MKNRVLREPDAAEYIGVSVSYLRQSRSRAARCDGPPFVKQGRTVGYLVDDLDTYLEKHRVVPVAS